MEVEPARIAAMLQPLADKHNADPARAAAMARAQASGVRLAFPELTGWDLAKAWLVAASCWTAQQFKDAADLGIHRAQAALRVLENGKWLDRVRTRDGDRFRQRFPNNADFADHGELTHSLLCQPGPGGSAKTGPGKTPETDRAGANAGPDGGAIVGGGMSHAPALCLSVTIQITLIDEPNAARRRATDARDSAQARDGAEPDSAPARWVPARQRAGVAPGSAPAREPEARQRAAGSPGALREEVNTENTESSETDRSIDRIAREGTWSTPGQDDPLSVILGRETGTPFSDPSTPDLVTLFRRVPPGQLFGTFLALVAEQGRANLGALNAHAEGTRGGPWTHAAMRDALVALGVRDHATADALAYRVCPELLTIVRARMAKRTVQYPGRWIPACLARGDVQEEALAAAQQQHKGRTAADAQRNGHQLAANAARIDAKARQAAEAKAAEERKAEELDTIRRATDRQLRDALAHLVSPEGRRCNIIVGKLARAQIVEQLAAKTAARDIARHDRIRPAVVLALAAIRTPAPPTAPTTAAAHNRAQEAAVG